MSWWRTGFTLCLDRDGHVYSSADRHQWIGHVASGPRRELAPGEWQDWEFFEREWREWGAEDLEAEDWRQYRLGLSK